MDHVTGIRSADASLLKGDSQQNIAVDDEDLGDSTEGEIARYEQVIRELNEFEEASESSTNSDLP